MIDLKDLNNDAVKELLEKTAPAERAIESAHAQDTFRKVYQKIIDNLNIDKYFFHRRIDKYFDKKLDALEVATKEFDSAPTKENEIKMKNAEDKTKLRISEREYIIECCETIFEFFTENGNDLKRYNEKNYIFIDTHYIEIENHEIKKMYSAIGLALGIPKKIAAFYRFAKEMFEQTSVHIDRPAVNLDTFDLDYEADFYPINLKNGILLIYPDASVKLINHTPNFSTFFTHCLNYDYNPSAQSDIFEKWLNEMIPIKENRMVLQEFIASALSVDLRLEKMLVCLGDGANGKSTFANIVMKLLGYSNVNSGDIADITNDEKYARQSIVGKCLTISTETNFAVNVPALKQMVSGEPVPVRQIYETPYTTNNYGKFMVLANELPKFAEKTHGFERRFLFVHWGVTIAKEDRIDGFEKEITKNPAQMEGVLNWALLGLTRLLTTNNRKFTDNPDNGVLMEKMKFETSSVLQWIEYKQVKSSNIDKSGTLELAKWQKADFVYSHYKRWCSEAGNKPYKATNFYKEMTKVNLPCIQKKEDIDKDILTSGRYFFIDFEETQYNV